MCEQKCDEAADSAFGGMFKNFLCRIKGKKTLDNKKTLKKIKKSLAFSLRI